MPVGLKSPGQLHAVDGVRLSAMHCGIKADEKISDLVLIEIAESANTATVFTTNKFCAAPVVVAKQHLAGNIPVRYLLINSGNANAGTGDSGHQGALACCAAVADHGAVHSTAVLPFSTGVIAAELPVTKINAAIPLLFARLHEDNWLPAAQGIMTTDILPKAVSEVMQLAQGQTITITGMAKGSGMIRPDMATMLAFVATDAQIKPPVLRQFLRQVVDDSFNAITVDGDTSTNDACVLIATGRSGESIEGDDQAFLEALTRVFQRLSQSIIRDGEGATKFVEIEVRQAASRDEAREVGFTIAHSPLVKTALFACDPNWGRILAAIGRAKIETLDVSKVDLYLGETCLLRNGLPDSAYLEELGQKEMDREDIKITVILGQGESVATIWTTDLSYEYVKINAEYRS
ncbi:MAG: bifunctional glutamate N-acetyltransferase/amino-acid acetyltransferase ArgJ [Gammaproteobacteria bacterium]|nr:bifunctional glutamate N-acetyltransferase/amino-acid acetyltransferase ArgJ [Gammaproteobacteria bacterium]